MDNNTMPDRATLDRATAAACWNLVANGMISIHGRHVTIAQLHWITEGILREPTLDAGICWLHGAVRQYRLTLHGELLGTTLPADQHEARLQKLALAVRNA